MLLLVMVMEMVQMFLISLFLSMYCVWWRCVRGKEKLRDSVLRTGSYLQSNEDKKLFCVLSLFHQNTKYETQNTVRTSSTCAIGNHNRVRTIAAIEHGFFGIFVHASLWYALINTMFFVINPSVSYCFLPTTQCDVQTIQRQQFQP